MYTTVHNGFSYTSFLSVVLAQTGSGGPTSIRQSIVGELRGHRGGEKIRDEEDVEDVVRDEEGVQKNLCVFHHPFKIARG